MRPFLQARRHWFSWPHIPASCASVMFVDCAHASISYGRYPSCSLRVIRYHPPHTPRFALAPRPSPQLIDLTFSTSSPVTQPGSLKIWPLPAMAVALAFPHTTLSWVTAPLVAMTKHGQMAEDVLHHVGMANLPGVRAGVGALVLGAMTEGQFVLRLSLAEH